MNRRDFLCTTGALGAGALLAPTALAAPAAPTVPTRPFGRSKTPVSVLGLGTMFDTVNNQLLLRAAFTRGVTYWDTADCYEGGESEVGIGKYLARFPDERGKMFLVSKSDDRDPAGMSRLLEQSLKRLGTDYIDLYYVHGIADIGELNDKTRAWAAQSKAAGLIRQFGFSNHKNEAKNLAAAAKLDWIDGILTSYNVGLRGDKAMQDAVAACHAAGIGLTAMKTARGGDLDPKNPRHQELALRHVKAGFTKRQARIKAVLSDERFSSVLMTIDNTKVLEECVGALAERPG